MGNAEWDGPDTNKMGWKGRRDGRREGEKGGKENSKKDGRRRAQWKVPTD